MIGMILFQTFVAHIWEIYYWNIERFIKKCSNSVNFELEKGSCFFKWVRILPEIDWYRYQGPSPALMCIVWHQTKTKTLMRWSVTSEPSVAPPPPRNEDTLDFHMLGLIYSNNLHLLNSLYTLFKVIFWKDLLAAGAVSLLQSILL